MKTEIKNKDSKSFCFYFATWFGTGLLKPIPPFKGMASTYGSFFALPFCYGLILYTRALLVETSTNVDKMVIYSFLLIIFFSLGIVAIPLAQKELGPQIDWKGKIKTRDQNQIVVDEVFGMLVSCFPILFVPKILVIHFILAFILFRFFDITKFFPAGVFDRIKNPSGVMLDDYIAGMYSAVILEILIFYVL